MRFQDLKNPLISGSLFCLILLLCENARGEEKKSSQPEISELLTYSNWTPAVAESRGLPNNYVSNLGKNEYGVRSSLSRQFSAEEPQMQMQAKIGGGEGGGHRGSVVDWLARLIGVQGKTLGEFLREYQVHVLYDLVFTFFKWIFFLYAGLLIP